MTCSVCGAENPTGKRFCGDCGTALAAACPTCGATNPPGKRFCGDCGTALAAGAGATPSEPAAANAPAAAGSGRSAERRLVTVLFADLVGFTPFAEERDSEDVRETLSRYFELARDVIGRYGGTVEKFIGDAVMAVWGAPTAREDDAERAVRAGLELVEAIPSLGPGIQARCGVLTGEVAVTLGAVGEGMVAGDIVNTAARLQSAAAPGTVLVGETTQRAASSAIAFEPAGDQVLKGKAAPVPSWRALRIIAERGGRGRSAGLEAPFVGRTEELRLLKELYHATQREGRLRLVSVMGPAGIGKSRLAWEFLKYLDGIVGTVWWHDGRCPAYGDGLAFWALGEMVRGRCGLAETDDEAATRAKVAATLERHVPDAAERRWIEPALLALLGFGSGLATEQLFAAWRTFFERLAATAPVVMVFEDLHFADPGLLDFLDSLLEWSRTAAIYVVTLARPELLERRADWGAAKRSFTSLHLEPLPEPAMRELLLGLVPGLPDEAVGAVVARADGIPLYAVETVRALLADGRIREEDGAYVPSGDLTTLAVPETLTALIGSRLDALAPEDRSLVQDAAVLGQSFTLDSLASVSGRTAAELEPRLKALVRRELLVALADPRSPERGQYAFVQAMIREVAYNTLAKRDRRARHLAAARYFESLGSDELAGALAGQYVAALRDTTDPAEAEALAVQARLALTGAAERAVGLGSHEQATALFLQAAGVATEPTEQGRLLVRAGLSAGTAGRYGRGVDLLADAIARYEAAGDGDGVAAATTARASVLLDGRRIGEAVTLLEPLATRTDLRDETLAELLSTLSRAYMRASRYQESIDIGDRSLPISERLRLDRVTAETLTNKGSALGYVGRLQEAIALLDAARRMAHDRGWVNLELRSTNNLAATSVGEDIERTAELGSAALALAERVGDRSMANFLRWGASSTLYTLARRWDEMIAGLEEALRGDLDDTDRVAFLSVLLDYRSARGLATEEDVAEVERRSAAMSDAEARVYVRLSIAYARFMTGDVAAARSISADALATAPTFFSSAVLFAASCLRSGEAAAVRAALDDAMADPAASGTLSRATIATLTATLAAIEGRIDDARRSYLAAVETLRTVHSAMGVAWVAMDAARVVGVGDPAIAALVAEARATLEPVGAVAILALLDAAEADGRRSPAARADGVRASSEARSGS